MAWTTPPRPTSPHPGAQQEVKRQKGLPLQSRPISAQERPALRRGRPFGRRRQRALGHPSSCYPEVINPKSDPESITWGAVALPRTSTPPKSSWIATYRLQIHTSITVDAESQPTWPQIWQSPMEISVSVFLAFYWGSPDSLYKIFKGTAGSCSSKS